MIRKSAENLAAILRNFRIWPQTSSGEHLPNVIANIPRMLNSETSNTALFS